MNKIVKTELCEYMYKYGSDKCPQLFHSYTPIYFEHVKEIKNECKVVIEIGVGNRELMKKIVPLNKYTPGASLRAWRDFFPNANVFGLDINTTDFFECDRITCLYTDQSNANALKDTFNTIKTELKTPDVNANIIIDDGSHIVNHMLLSFKELKQHLSVGGLYIIEDIRKKDINIFTTLGCDSFELIKTHMGTAPKTSAQDCFVIYRRTK